MLAEMMWFRSKSGISKWAINIEMALRERNSFQLMFKFMNTSNWKVTLCLFFQVCKAARVCVRFSSMNVNVNIVAVGLPAHFCGVIHTLEEFNQIIGLREL